MGNGECDLRDHETRIPLLTLGPSLDYSLQEFYTGFSVCPSCNMCLPLHGYNISSRMFYLSWRIQLAHQIFADICSGR